MGVLQYQRAFIPGFSHISRPIFQTLKKGVAFEWTREAKMALDKLIRIIVNDPLLAQPDPDAPFEIEIDASNFATGAVLIQRDPEGRKVAISYDSEALTASERNYDVYDRELLSFVRALRRWRHFLEGSPHRIKVWTDHQNLARHREAQELSDRMKRVVSFLSRFDYEFHHVPGTTNVVADALSRRPDHVPPEGEKPLVTVLPDHLFVRLIRPAQLELEIKQHQEEPDGKERIKEWQDSHNLERRKRYHWMGSALVVVQPEKGGKKTTRNLSRWTNGGTSREGEDLQRPNATLLVARDEEIRASVHHWVCHLPSIKDRHSEEQPGPQTDTTSRRSHPLSDDHDGPDCQAAKVQRIRLNCDDHGPRLHKRGNLDSVFGDDGSRGFGRRIQATRLPIHRTASEDYLRQGHPIHLSLRQRNMPTIGNRTEHQQRLSSSDRRTVREDKSARRNGTANLLQLPAKRLGRVSASRTVHAQCASI
jgi:hypothetical protein